jgi:hypothetical protein
MIFCRLAGDGIPAGRQLGGFFMNQLNQTIREQPRQKQPQFTKTILRHMYPLLQDIAKKYAQSVEQGDDGFLIIKTEDFFHLCKVSTTRRYIRMLSREGYIYYILGTFHYDKELHRSTPKAYRVDSHFLDIFSLYKIFSVEEPSVLGLSTQALFTWKEENPSGFFDSACPINYDLSNNETSKRSKWHNIYIDILTQNSKFEVSNLMAANALFFHTNNESLNIIEEKKENRGGDHNNTSLMVSFYPDAGNWYEISFSSIKSFWAYCNEKIGYNKSYKTLHRQIKQGKRNFGKMEIIKIENK